jgi:hypothetical protein
MGNDSAPAVSSIMKSTFRAACPEDLDAIRDFLARAFSTSREAPMLLPAAMRWKYWTERGDWSGPRAYLLERDGEITAFAGLWPVTFGTDADAVRGVHMIDWASAKEAPGAGLALVQKLAAMFDFILAIGGSDMTQTVLPAFGFAECARQWEGARPLRPLRQMFTHQRRDWKLPARLARNAMWAIRPIAGMGRFVEVTPERVNAATSTHGMPRSPAFFEFLAKCPMTPFRFFAIADGERERGYFVLSLVRRQARVAGLWLREGDWRGAYALALRAAKGISGANEVIAAGTGAETKGAAAAAGFHVLDGPPVYLLNKKGKLRLPPDFQFQLSDDDHAFLDTGAADYRT